MKTSFLFLGGAALLAALGFPAGTEAQRIKCWTDANGSRACGSSVPPEVAQRGYELRDSTGGTTTVDAAPDKNELEAERAARREREAREREEALARRKVEQANTILRNTYATESELIEARDSQTGTFEIRITQTEAMIRQTDRKVIEVEQAAAAAERAGKEVDPALLREREEGLAQIATQRTNIIAIEAKRAALIERFEQDLARYRKLAGG